MPDASADSLSRVSGALARHLLTRLPPEQPHTRADLPRLPLPVAHYLDGVLDRRLAREAALPASGWFDGEAEAVQAAARAWRTATRDTARFPAEAWADAVHDAARQVLGYLVEPVETLTARVFADDEAALPLEAARARMATFSPYPYLREVAEGYFARKEIEEVGRDDFERLLRRIDRRMVSPFGPPDWLSLLDPLFDLLRPLPDAGVPAPLLRRFFEAKGYDDLARALDADAYDEATLRATLTAALPDLDVEEPTAEAAEPPEAEPTTVSVSEVRAPEDDGAEEPSEPEPPGPEEEAPASEAMEGEAPEPEAAVPAPEPEAPEPEVPEPEAPEPEAVEAPPAPASPVAPEVPPRGRRPPPEAPEPEAPGAEPEEPEPLWLRLARQREASAPDAPELQPTASEPAPESTEAGAPGPEAEPLWKRFAAGASAAPAAAGPGHIPEPLARLEARVLGPSATERRAWYVAHLTGGSEADYRAVLEQLDAAPSWTAASQIIAREVFRKHQVNIYSDAAIAFTDAAEARFTRGGNA